MAPAGTSGPATGLVYFAALPGGEDLATRLSGVAGAAFERVEGDAGGGALYRAHTADAMLELQDVDEWLEGTIYSLVAQAEDDGPDDLDAYLAGLARAAGASRQWSHAAYRAARRERTTEPE